MLTGHSLDRMRERMTASQTQYYAAVIDALTARLVAERTYAVRVWRDSADHGTLTYGPDGTGESNGTDLWAIIRNRRVTTVFWRRPAQPCNPAAFGVDYVLGTKGR